MNLNPSSFDSTYHSRHSQRAEKKARMIAAFLARGSSLLDIGCNAGLISKALLERHVAAKITGVEINGSILHSYLRDHSGFHLIEREIQETHLSQTYDSAIYLSVHHHVVAHHGIDVAVRTLRHIVSHCRKILFFETGKIAEGSYWPWQKKLRNYFRFDEEHYCHLFRCIEDLVEDFRIIGYNWIHGIRREIFELKMKSDTERERMRQRLCHHHLPMHIMSSDAPKTLSSGPFTATAVVKDENQSKMFRKAHLGNPLASYREHCISSSVNSNWVVRSVGLDSENRILFPFIEQIETDHFATKGFPQQSRKALAGQLRSIRKTLTTKSVLIREPFGSSKVSKRPYNICDFNTSNLLVASRKSGEPVIRVVDFAYQAPSYAWKNDFNFARAFGKLRADPLFRIRLLITGFCRLLLKLIGHQFLSRKQRIVNRFPSCTGAIFTEVNSYLGSKVRRLRNSIRV